MKSTDILRKDLDGAHLSNEERRTLKLLLIAYMEENPAEDEPLLDKKPSKKNLFAVALLLSFLFTGISATFLDEVRSYNFSVLKNSDSAIIKIYNKDNMAGFVPSTALASTTQAFSQ